MTLAALVLSIACEVGAAACTQSTETSPKTPQTTPVEDVATETSEDADIAAVRSAFGEGGPLNPAGRCENACYAIYLVQSAICSRLPRPQRRPCWERAADDLARCIRDCSRNP